MAFIHTSKRIVSSQKWLGSLRMVAMGTHRHTSMKNSGQVYFQTRSLVDFASRDILGIQRFTGSQELTLTLTEPNMELDAPSLQERTIMENALAALHNKEYAVATSAPLLDVLSPLYADLKEGDYLFVDEILHLTDVKSLKSCKGRIQTFCADDMQDLEFMMRNRISRKKIIIIEHGSNTASIRKLRRICDLAEKTDAQVVLNDKNGAILFRHLSGDSPDLLNILKKPALIYSTLDLVSPFIKVNYIAGSNEMIEKLFPSRAAENLPSNLVRSVLKGFSVLPQLAADAYSSLTRSLRLKRALEEMGFIVKVEGYHLRIITEAKVAHKLVPQLWDCGIKVALADGESGQLPGISLAVTNVHSDENIKQLMVGLGEVMKMPQSGLKDSSSMFYDFPTNTGAPDMKLDKKEFNILESVYFDHHKNSDNDSKENGRQVATFSLVLDDAFYTGLI